jgi:hypothetical protein
MPPTTAATAPFHVPAAAPGAALAAVAIPMTPAAMGTSMTKHFRFLRLIQDKSKIYLNENQSRGFKIYLNASF